MATNYMTIRAQRAQELRDKARKRQKTSGTFQDVTYVSKPSSISKKSGPKMLQDATHLGTQTNTVTTGAGSQREGQKYRVMRDQAGNYYHVYGHGPNARKVRLSTQAAQAYGYGS
jgi:hypothetical protein